MNRLGYACINMSIPDKTTNRTIRQATYQRVGIKGASELALENLRDLKEIIRWNEAHNIKFFRLSSNVFPWNSTYELTDLPNYAVIKKLAEEIGQLIRQFDHRITTHPGPFNVLASPNKTVVERTYKELTDHAVFMDLLGLSQTPYNKINIHVGGTYGNKETALATWCENFQNLPASVKSRLTVENDDKVSCFTVKDLLFIHENVGIPICFDYHHHALNPGNETEEEAFHIAYATWKDIIPVVHVSESRDMQNPRAHSDYIVNKINTYGKRVDIMLECKQKDLALLHYRKLHSL